VVAFELQCAKCGWRTLCGRSDAIARLRLVGILRRETEPADDLLEAVFLDGAKRMTCPLCKEISLKATPATAEDAIEGDDWQAAVLCETCRQPIAEERLEALPGTKRCVACQGKTESVGGHDQEPDYCPHCGSLVEIRVSKGSGITRYRRFCTGSPPCRL
jgi:Zn finger protein HypA/HybF involved in hydrogenase expression